MDNKKGTIQSLPVRAGRRTYFFDVIANHNNDYFLAITESKRRMDHNGQFVYEKHKLFLYSEDFDKFADGLQEMVNYIRSEKGEDYGRHIERHYTPPPDATAPDNTPPTDVNFEDLD